jgi:catechol 2,3-dioxygenase-like lactoylglutathione lyase family enzyme
VIKGLYETHLPVRDLQRAIVFYEKLGLERVFTTEDVVFFWIKPHVSWLGLWVHEHADLQYHPSTRHLAFEVDYADIKRARDWLLARGIETRGDHGFEGTEPFVRPSQGNVSLYFDDPDGNGIEFICEIDIPASLRDRKAMYVSEFERLAAGSAETR